MEASAIVWSSLNQKNENKDMSYTQEGVFIHLYSSKTCEDKIIGGILSIEEKDSTWFLKWVPAPETTNTDKEEEENLTVDEEERINETSFEAESDSKNWMVVDEDQNRNEISSDDNQNIQSNQEDPFDFNFMIPMEELRSLKLSTKDVSWRYIIIKLNDGATLPALNFHNGGFDEFVKILDLHLDKVSSRLGNGWYDVTPLNQEALTKAFNQLDIFNPGTSRKPDLASRIFKDPFGSAVSGVTKFTSLVQDLINPVENVRPMNERANIMDVNDRFQFSPSDVTINGFEVITCTRLGDRLPVTRLHPMTEEEWIKFQDADGKVSDVDGIKKRIFRGGLEDSLRCEVWKYLLGFYNWDQSREENESKRIEKEKLYLKMKSQWKSFDEDQLSRFTEMSNRLSLIEKDVDRTDRKRSFYKSVDSVGRQKLYDILATYCMYDFDLGYVQGMSDLVSPLLEVLQNESTTFWCFVGYMDIMHDNFVMSQKGMRRQLRDLHLLIELINPDLWDDFVAKGSSDLYFCFRWLLVRFKREFSYEDIKMLWEVFWSGLPCKNFHLIFTVALLQIEEEYLKNQDCGFEEILKHVNEMSERIDLQKSLCEAEEIFNQIATCSSLPKSISHILKL